MIRKRTQNLQSRREFLKRISLGGSVLFFGGGRILFGRKEKDEPGFRDFPFQYRTISVARLAQVRDYLIKLERERRISSNPTYLRSIHGFEYQPPKELPGAKSIIIMSWPLKLASVIFHPDGKKVKILIPPGYVDSGIRLKDISEQIYGKIVKDRTRKLVRTKLPLKTMAVRSGLAEYGRNNITFIDDYGSFHQLLALYTDQDLPDQWEMPRMMSMCKGCSICIKKCPTQCIGKDRQNFVIDAGRCISLYNELADPFPDWIDPRVHHTLVGCLKCQYECPANEDYIGSEEQLAEFNAHETMLLLSDDRSDGLKQAVASKLKRLPDAEDLTTFSRNLKLAMSNLLNS